MPKPIQSVKFKKAIARHTKIRDLKQHFIQTHCTIPIPVEFDRLIARHTKIRDQNPSLGYICPGEPHERSPNAPKFEDRSQEETEWQEQGARQAAWNLSKNVFKLKEHEKEQHSSRLRKIGASLHQR